MYLHSLPDRRQRPRCSSRACLGRCRRSVFFGGFATHVRAGDDGLALARVGWTAGCCWSRESVRGWRLRCDQPWCRARDPQLQHRPSDRRGGVAGGTGRNGALRGYDADRDGAASWSPHDGCSAGSCDGVTRFATLRGFRPVSAGRTAFYRSSAVSMSEESARVADAQPGPRAGFGDSAGRCGRSGSSLIAAVVVDGDQRPSGSGNPRSRAGSRRRDRRVRARSRIRDPRTRSRARSAAVQASVIAAMGAAGVALVALQPRGATDLAGGAAVWMAVARLPLVLGLAVGAAVGVALCVALALSGGSSAGVVADGAPVRAARGHRLPDQAGAGEPGHNRAVAGRARRRARGAARGGGDQRARSDRERAPRRPGPHALRRGDPAAGRAEAGRAASRRAPRCVRRSTEPASWSGTGLPVPVRPSARSAETNCRASPSSSHWSRASGPT